MSTCVSQLVPPAITTAAGTWEAAPAQALVNTMATVAMTTTVSAKSNKSIAFTGPASLSLLEESVSEIPQCLYRHGLQLQQHTQQVYVRGVIIITFLSLSRSYLPANYLATNQTHLRYEDLSTCELHVKE